MTPAAKWALGVGVVALGLGALWWARGRIASMAVVVGPKGGGGGGGGSTPSGQGDRNAEITVSTGPADISLYPATAVTLMLPSGASWAAPLSATGSVRVGSAPGSGTNPAGFVYDGGTQDAGGYGGHVTASYTDASGISQTQTLNIADA